MRENEIMEIFSAVGAYKQGHFKLSSGLHSGAYLQCALVLADPMLAAKLCSSMAERLAIHEPDVVVGPAIGGIVFAYELARNLKARALFTERDSSGKMALRRGFKISPGSRVLVAEDVLTTGGSAKEVINLLEEDGIIPRAVVALVDRSGGRLDLGGVKHESLVRLDIAAFEADKCPLCQEGIPIEKPGSRK